MIDYVKSAEINHCTIDELKDWFKEYPNSGKKIVRLCNGCGEERIIRFCDYNDWCIKCGHNLSEVKDAARLNANSQWSDQSNRDRMSEIKKKYHKDHPEDGRFHSEFMVARFGNSTARNDQSKIMKNSNACKIEQNRQRGGNDILKHHFIYDHEHPENHTVEITRSEHTSHHNWMRRNGLEVLHLNVTEENKDIFKLRKSNAG